MKWYLKVMRENYANFDGRARRKEYWMFSLSFFLITVIIYFLAGLLVVMMGDTINYTSNEWVPGVLGGAVVIYFLIHIIPGLALTVRRLHDIGKSGWWYFIAFLPYVGSLILFIFSVMPGQVGENEWGPDPKASEAPKEKAPKEEAPKEEAPKEEAPKEEAPKEEAPE